MDNSTYALLAIAIITIGTFLLLPKGYRHYAILLPLLIIFLIAVISLFQVWGFSFKLLFLILAGLVMIFARMVGLRRM